MFAESRSLRYVELAWVKGHHASLCNHTADKLAAQGSSFYMSSYGNLYSVHHPVLLEVLFDLLRINTSLADRVTRLGFAKAFLMSLRVVFRQTETHRDTETRRSIQRHTETFLLKHVTTLWWYISALGRFDFGYLPFSVTAELLVESNTWSGTQLCLTLVTNYMLRVCPRT